MSRRRKAVFAIPLPEEHPPDIEDVLSVLTDAKAGWEGARLELDVERRELLVTVTRRRNGQQPALDLTS